MLRRAIVLGAIVAVLGACRGALPAGSPSEPEPPVAEQPEPGLLLIDPAALEALRAYGAEHPETFGGMWIEPPGGDRVVMAFTGDLEAHQAAVAEILPGTMVTQVTHTKAALDELQRWITAEATADVDWLSVGVDEKRNLVTFELKTNDPTLELRLEAEHGGMLDVIAYPIPGPWANVESGEGWRLLATGEGTPMEAYVVRAATSTEQWNDLWGTLALPGDQPEVDFAAEVVVSFAEGIGFSCPELRLDGVGIQDGVVYSLTSDPLTPRNCNDDLSGAAVFVVAVQREAVPDDGFTLRLRRDPANFTEDVKVALP